MYSFLIGLNPESRECTTYFKTLNYKKNSLLVASYAFAKTHSFPETYEYASPKDMCVQTGTHTRSQRNQPGMVKFQASNSSTVKERGRSLARPPAIRSSSPARHHAHTFSKQSLEGSFYNLGLIPGSKLSQYLQMLALGGTNEFLLLMENRGFLKKYMCNKNVERCPWSSRNRKKKIGKEKP